MGRILKVSLRWPIQEFKDDAYVSNPPELGGHDYKHIEEVVGRCQTNFLM